MGTRSQLFLVAVLFLLAPGLESSAATGALSFNKDIRPLLSDTCFACHGPDVKQRKGGLRLDTAEGAFGRTKSGGEAFEQGGPDLELPVSKGEKVLVPVMKERAEARDTFIHERGNFLARGAKVSPGVPAFLLGAAGQPGDRLAFARWLVNGRHPLVARVVVNLFWQGYFGHGLVRTPSDFGLQGESPTHPELLDSLATEFVASGWNMKALHRLIVTSATYRQSSRTSVATVADELTVIRSMHTDTNVHDPAVNFMNCGTLLGDRPTLGAWLSYGLGSENSDLPAYIVLTSGSSDGQPLLQSFWGNRFWTPVMPVCPFETAGLRCCIWITRRASAQRIVVGNLT